MKGLKDYLQECCDGAATPASTMGAGNPAAPDLDGTPGSGDMFPTAKAKKQKRRKKDVRVSWDKKDPVTDTYEGLLSADFDINDQDMKLPAVVRILEKARTTGHSRLIKELTDLLGNPLRSGAAKKTVGNIRSSYDDGITILTATEMDPNQAYHIPKNTNSITIYRFRAKSLYPDVLQIIYGRDGEDVRTAVFVERVATFKWTTKTKYWILGPDPEDLIGQLAATIKRKN